MRDLLVSDPLGKGRPALAAGESFAVAGVFRLTIVSTAEDSARVRFEWIDRRAPAAPRVGVRLRGRRALVRWSRVTDGGSGVDRYRVLVDGRVVRTIAASRSVGPVELPNDREANVSLAGGAHRIGVRAVDRAGNTGRVGSYLV